MHSGTASLDPQRRRPLTRAVPRSGPAPPARKRAVAVVALFVVATLGACGGTASRPVLNWYINPDNGGQRALAAKCSEASGGRYRIDVSTLPNDATGQREQLVRRLAAKDASIDLVSLDPPFIPEFANAGFLRPFTDPEAAHFTAGILQGPIESATWEGRLVAAPFWANTQLLWYRKSVARRAGIDPAARPVTWDDLIDAAERTGTTLEVQGNRYEGYMVLISALVASAGGRILDDPEAGKEVRPAIDSFAGQRAAAILSRLARSPAANPGLSTADEEGTRAAFQAERGGFMVNWPYVHGAAQEAVADGALDRAVLDDIGWARYPRVDAGTQSRPPLGGINIGIGAFSRHQDLALEALRCITTQESMAEYMISAKNPSARAAVYDDPDVREIFPMADLIRQSIQDSQPRPKTPYYTDVSSAVVRSFHPARAVRGETPARAAELIVDVLHDKVLL
jgi:multiple sugar transport system substrate-binding protein